MVVHSTFTIALVGAARTPLPYPDAVLFVVLAGSLGPGLGRRGLRGRQGDAAGRRAAGRLAVQALQPAAAGALPGPAPQPAPTPASLAWGALAGLFGAVGVVVFYRALSAGAMTVVAPDHVGHLRRHPGRGRPRRRRTSRPRGAGRRDLRARRDRAGQPRSPAAGRRLGRHRSARRAGRRRGVGFALFFVFLARANVAAGGDAGLWPIASAQLAALVLTGALSWAPGPASGEARGRRPALAARTLAGLDRGRRPLRHDRERALPGRDPLRRPEPGGAARRALPRHDRAARAGRSTGSGCGRCRWSAWCWRSAALLLVSRP